MSDDTKQKLTAWVDLLYKIGVPLGLAALFFLKSNFATRPELQEVNDRVGRIETLLAVMTEQSKTNSRQDERIADHEIRLRSLEARK